MRISIALGTWNRCELLRQTLEQLTQILVPASVSFEVIVVNNNCTDATDEVIEQFCGRLPLRRLFEPRAGASHARNAALDAATGDYVLFIDDDVLVDTTWLVEFVAAAAAHPDATVIGGTIVPVFPRQPDPDLLVAFPVLQNGFCGLDHHLPPGLLPDGLPMFSANMAFRMAGIRDLRFNTSLGPTGGQTVTGEDVELLRRVRAAAESVIWWPAMRVRHFVTPSRMTLEYLLEYMTGAGTLNALTSPSPANGYVFDVPRWLWRRAIEARIKCLCARLQSPDLWPHIAPLFGPAAESNASPRVRTLIWQREIAFVGGMIRGHRRKRSAGGATRRAAVRTDATAVGPVAVNL